MLYLLVAILSGVSIVLARVINYVLAEKIGVFQGTFFNYIFGLLGSLLLLLLSKESFGFAINGSPAPWWAYLGGLLGVVVIALSSLLSSRISAFYLTLLLFIGQLFTSIVIDYLSTGIFSFGQIFGGLLVFMGLGYNLWVDQKATKTAE